MKLRGIIASALAFALSTSLAFAQGNQGTSPLTPTKGGTNSAFVGFTGPASSIKTFTLPNASDTIATLAAIQTFTAAKTFNNATLLLAGSSSGTTTLVASAAASGTLTLPAATDTLVGKATTDTLTNKTISGGSNTLSSIANSALSNMAAYTLKGNATGSTAAPADIDITGLTSKPSPVSGDIVLIQDSAASNAFKQTTVGALATAGSVASYNGRTGAVTATGTDVPLRGYLSALTLSTAGSSATFGIATGVATDSTNTSMMALASAYTKTTSAWALGTAVGSLDVGTIANSTWYHAFIIKRPDTSVVDVMTSLAPGTSSTVTITNASPGVVTWAAHGLQANAPVVFTTTGSLLTGLTAGTQYYVKTVASVDTFTVSATQGGTVINTSSAGSGTHTATSNPILANANAAYTLFRRIGSMKTNGSAQWTKFFQNGNYFQWDSAVGDVNASYTAASPGLQTLTIPPGVVTSPAMTGRANSGSTGASFLYYTPGITTTTPDTPLGNETMYVPVASTNYGFAMPAGQAWSNTSQQVGVNANAATVNVAASTIGWLDLRGQ